MTRQELVDRIQRAQRRTAMLIVGTGLLTLAFILSTCPGNAAELGEDSDRWIDLRDRLRTLLTVYLTTLVAGGVVFIGFYRPVPCPRCRHDLSSRRRAAVAIATGRCGGCGAKVIEDVE